MSKQRYINTKFWDDTYITNLDPVEKLLFLYFLTNPLANIAGIYEISLKRMGFDTGIDADMVNKIIKRLQKDKKVYYVKGYIVIPNFPKHQEWHKNAKIQRGIEIIIDNLPNTILKGINTLSIPYTYPLNYSNSNSNSNNNNNNNSNTKNLLKNKKELIKKFSIPYKIKNEVSEEVAAEERRR